MLKVGHGLDFDQEPLGADHSGELGAQHFDCDLAVVTEVMGEIDRGHPARCYLFIEAIAVGERGLNRREEVLQDAGLEGSPSKMGRP